MRKSIKLILYSLPLLASVGCDTKEDVFFVAPEPQETEILTVDNSQLSFIPEGATYEIAVTSVASWEVTLTGSNAGQFKVSPMSGKGNGVITVTAGTNQSEDDYRATLQITPLNFEMEPVKISVIQSYTTFRISSYPSTELTLEEGGSLSMTANSSVAWQLVVTSHDADGSIGDIEWLTVTPGLSGEGKADGSPQDFRFTWKPNYSEQQRTIRFQFKPQSDVITRQETFTLTQAAGTRPQDVRCQLDRVDIVDADVSFLFNSKSRIKDCGLVLYKVNESSVDSITTYRPEKSGDVYAQNMSAKFSLKDMTESSTFRLVPYAENEVGRVTGESREFSTGIKPENMVYQGVEIVNADNGGVVVETDLKTASVTLTVTSDVAPLDSRIESAIMTFDGRSVNGVATPLSDDSWRYVFNTSDSGVELTPNKEYAYTIVITGTELPRSQGQVVNPSATYSGSFKTKGMTPGSGDNDKPTVGE